MTVARMPHWFGHEAQKHYRCTVKYLDDSSWETTYTKSEDSQKLFDRICDHLNLIEKDYFGLRFVDEKKQRRWLDLGKNARKQLKKAGKDVDNVILCFRVKFYPPDPILRLHEELTLYQLFLQLRRDLQHGRLYGSSGDEAILLACILQSELGNISAGIVNVPEDYRVLMKHGKKGETKTIEQWHYLRDLSPSECEKRFVEQAARLDTFGIDPHQVKNEEDQSVFLGYNHFGIIAFQGSKRILHLDWAHILKMSYEGRTFLVQFMRESKPQTRGLKCPTSKAAKQLWRNALETKIFFTAPTSKTIKPVSNGSTIFSRASRVRFSGRVAREAMEASSTLHRSGVTFQRAAFAHKLEPDVYEGVVATPALHRRASLFPKPKESGSGSPVPGENRSEELIVVTPEPPAYMEAVPSEVHHPPASPSPFDMPPEPSSSTKLPSPMPSRTGSDLQFRRPVTESILARAKQEMDQNIDDILSNGRFELTREISQTVQPASAAVAVQHRQSALGTVAVVGLISGTAILGIYTLYDTNWLSPAPLLAAMDSIREFVASHVLSWWN
ncbi:FERM domain-containing protein 5-like isoform X2 [Paramacrobiotus metropolitanus]|nr:FERM domain-containing protein 5-like isoform X2 [Paramacrobiotus metropolitanus]